MVRKPKLGKTEKKIGTTQKDDLSSQRKIKRLVTNGLNSY